MPFADQPFSVEQVERVAVALYQAECLVGDLPFNESPAPMQDSYRALARRAIGALGEPVCGVSANASDQPGAAE